MWSETYICNVAAIQLQAEEPQQHQRHEQRVEPAMISHRRLKTYHQGDSLRCQMYDSLSLSLVLLLIRPVPDEVDPLLFGRGRGEIEHIALLVRPSVKRAGTVRHPDQVRHLFRGRLL